MKVRWSGSPGSPGSHKRSRLDIHSASEYELEGYSNLKQRFCTRSISFESFLVRPGCQTGHAYSRTERVVYSWRSHVLISVWNGWRHKLFATRRPHRGLCRILISGSRLTSWVMAMSESAMVCFTFIYCLIVYLLFVIYGTTAVSVIFVSAAFFSQTRDHLITCITKKNLSKLLNSLI